MSTATASSATGPLWFEPFLQQLKRELGYPIDLAKYGQLLTWANTEAWSSKEVAMSRLYAVCKLLFLQKEEHETTFQELFRNYIIDELVFENTLLTPEQNAPVLDEKNTTSNVEASEPVTEAIKPLPLPESNTDTLLDPEPPDEAENDEPLKTTKYLNLTIPHVKDSQADTTVSAGSSPYLFTEAYLPLTRREMIHGWRHLRRRERYRLSDKLDVVKTVQHIAREGLLLKPVFEKEQVNSDDLLLILADRRGSMTPFHSVTDKLIETALKEGGHRNALVYYFYNCPVDVVYENKNLTGAVPLSLLYSKMRPDHTNALIISDAGAARGEVSDMRIQKTHEFLYGISENGETRQGLHKSALFVSWLNPMPEHRWRHSSAWKIAKDPNTPMYSLMDDGYRNFLQVIQKLMGK